MKQEGVALVQRPEIAGLLGGVITFTMVALASVRQHLQQAATDHGEDLAPNIVLTLKELNGPASSRLGHALRLPASSFNFISEEMQEEGCITVVAKYSKLNEMLNRAYPHV